jgi:hypothetical protein
MVIFVLTIKSKLANILLKNNLPVFHYSIFESGFKPQKNVLYFHYVVEFSRRLFRVAALHQRFWLRVPVEGFALLKNFS